MQLTVITITALLAWSASAAAVVDTKVLETRDNYYCGSAHVPSTNDCNELYNAIQSGTAYANLQSASPRTLRSENCFVSWSNNVVGNSLDLLPYVGNLINSCVYGGKSGIVKNVHLYNQGEATAICVSNRGTGCEN
ncbi:hypothetical protein NQ176_g1751 [Zarea fungicola]|uniref:Uncharacterized protein n=1 Tax=Zarea fungicola TaxID=93591 RepID=A0ACC1NS26_9HYPO|nr:hypothetical protein NQ176_g1751 [Lecanicillium fungicola]